jgi:hypothetical protein
MKAAFARILMAIAASSLGCHRREWAQAMHVEFEEATADGKPLSFALGCLMTAWRQLPAHEEGRFTIASHLLVFVLLLPMAALLLAIVVTNFPNSYVAPIGAFGLLEKIDGQGPLLNEATLSAIPSLAFLVAALATFHLRLAWLVLQHDWSRVASLAPLLAVTTVTLIIFSSVVFACLALPLTQAAALAVELTAVSALARWHARAFGETSNTAIPGY